MSDIGVYVHWPYCAHICPYCDFNVYRARNLYKEPLLAAIEGDIAAQAQRFGRRERRQHLSRRGDAVATERRRCRKDHRCSRPCVRLGCGGRNHARSQSRGRRAVR